MKFPSPAPYATTSRQAHPPCGNTSVRPARTLRQECARNGIAARFPGSGTSFSLKRPCESPALGAPWLYETTMPMPYCASLRRLRHQLVPQAHLRKILNDAPFFRKPQCRCPSVRHCAPPTRAWWHLSTRDGARHLENRRVSLASPQRARPLSFLAFPHLACARVSAHCSFTRNLRACFFYSHTLCLKNLEMRNAALHRNGAGRTGGPHEQRAADRRQFVEHC